MFLSTIKSERNLDTYYLSWHINAKMQFISNILQIRKKADQFVIEISFLYDSLFLFRLHTTINSLSNVSSLTILIYYHYCNIEYVGFHKNRNNNLINRIYKRFKQNLRMLTIIDIIKDVNLILNLEKNINQ